MEGFGGVAGKVDRSRQYLKANDNNQFTTQGNGGAAWVATLRGPFIAYNMDYKWKATRPYLCISMCLPESLNALQRTR